MNLDSAGLQVLSREECMRLLATSPVGRIVFTDRALPAIQPINFFLDGDGEKGESIVIRTEAGSKLAAATRQTVVAFEADDFDASARTGWSVIVVGRARAAEDPAEIARLATLPLVAWAPGKRDHFIVVTADQVSGRRVPPR